MPQPVGSEVQLEEGLPEEVAHALQAKGHHVIWPVGGFHAGASPAFAWRPTSAGLLPVCLLTFNSLLLVLLMLWPPSPVSLRSQMNRNRRISLHMSDVQLFRKSFDVQQHGQNMLSNPHPQTNSLI